MKRLSRIFLSGLVTLALAASCRSVVMEDRSSCPRFVFFEITNPQHFHSYDSVYTTVFRHPEGSQVSAGLPLIRDIQDKTYFVEVRKTNAVKGYGLIGYDTYVQSGNSWLIPIGEQADTLFRFSYLTPLEEESIIIPVELVKEHAKVTVQFVGIESFTHAGGRFPFDLVIRSNTNGIDALSGLPTRGEFEYRPEETETGRFSFILPRQADSGLKMELYGRPFIYDKEGFFRSFDLQEILLEKGGITWKEKNLPDIYIEIDYQETTVEVRVDPWGETTLVYDY